ncbi:MAG: type I restriction enzyme HsdR N-terminal domain-containing protein [Stellaceae bacterium]
MGRSTLGCRYAPPHAAPYFQPASGLNQETRRLYGASLFAIVRQLHYSAKNENSLDLVLFLNGIPIFTAELKNPLTGQNVEDAIGQYKRDRDRAGKMTDCREHHRCKCREPPRFVGVTNRADHAPVAPMAGVEDPAQVFIVAEVAVGFVKQ